MANEQLLAMTEVNKEAVITACESVIRSISEHSSIVRRKCCYEWLASQEKNWRSFWRFFGYKKPTLRDAIVNYYNYEREWHFVSCYCLAQKSGCCSLLRTARATLGQTMWISDAGVRTCSLGK
jgi:hypothetical protein